MSVDESGRVRDIAGAVYRELWKDLSEAEFEDRWIIRRMVLMKGANHVSDDIAILDLIGTDDKDQLIALLYMFQEASEAEQVVRRRLSRLRQAQSGRYTRLVPMEKELSRVPFKRELITRVAQALARPTRAAYDRQVNEVSAHHELTYQKGALSWTEQDWSWTLLRSQNGSFVWQHQQSGARRGEVRKDVFLNEDAFIDFFTQLSEESACIYSGLLLYKDEQNAVKLDGTPRIAHFVRLITLQTQQHA